MPKQAPVEELELDDDAFDELDDFADDDAHDDGDDDAFEEDIEDEDEFEEPEEEPEPKPAPKPKKPKKQPAPSPQKQSKEMDWRALISEETKKSTQASMKYTDQRVKSIHARLDKQEALLTSHGKKITKLEKRMDALVLSEAKREEGLISGGSSKKKKSKEEQSAESNGGGILDTTFGTIGGLAHGIVDTAAFVLESVVDIATLGKARRS